MRKFGLIGYPLSHSFSKKYFTQKFERENIDNCEYELYPLENIGLVESLFKDIEGLAGINVTIPYKEQVIPYLDAVEHDANAIGAVNTIKIVNGHKTGFNTDVYGFEISLRNTQESNQIKALNHALILGTGGASKAVEFVLKKMNIAYQYVSRTAGEGRLSYEQVTEDIMANIDLIVNTTPLGMKPNIETFPDLPYQAIKQGCIAFDLVYNPEKTAFMKLAENQGAHPVNGLEMLHLQAIRSWEIWNDVV